MRPIDINNINIPDYFSAVKKRIKDKNFNDCFSIREAKGGDSGFVYSLSCSVGKNIKKEKIFIKQTREYTKTPIDIKLDPKRIYWEQKFLKLFEEILGVGVVPHVYLYDKANNLIIMSDIVGSGSLLIYDLEKNYLHEKLGKKFGNLFAKLHSYGIKNNTKIKIKSTHQKFLKEALIYYNTAGALKVISKNVIDNIIKDSKDNLPDVLIWGDAKPKNIIIEKNNIRFFDLESVIKWDPAYDIGCLLSHWVLKIIENKKNVGRCESFIKEFLDEYMAYMKKEKVKGKIIRDIIKRADRYLGIMMLHRTDGMDQYIFSDNLKNDIRKKAVEIVKGKNFLVNFIR